MTTHQAILDEQTILMLADELQRAEAERCPTNSRGKVQDTIADNAACAGVILGEREVAPLEIDLPWVGAVLRKNAEVVETGLAAGVLGHPANGVVWLVRELARWGERVTEGEIVLGGSFTRPVPAAPGDVFDADYGALGAFSFRFGEGA
jgi:2-oxo-hept-3-ene-1,7-dioate hydratase